MSSFTLADVEAALRASWSVETCDPVDVPDWTADNPSRGQCGATTLVLHDLVGGELAVAEVHDGDRRQGYHAWLLTAGGLHIDLTREQFAAHEVVGEPKFLARPHRRPGRCVEEYELLRRRVYDRLGLDPAVPEDQGQTV